MSGIVHPLGNALKTALPGADPQNPALLAPAGAKILNHFSWWLEEAVGQSVEKGRQHLGAGDRSSGSLPEGNGGGSEFTGKVLGLLGKIEAEPENRKGKAAGSGNGFHQKACQLLVFVENIVGPFQKDLKAGQAANGIGGGKGTGDGKQGELFGGRLQKDRTP